MSQTSLPPPSQAIASTKNGHVTDPWYRYFLQANTNLNILDHWVFVEDRAALTNKAVPSDVNVVYVRDFDSTYSNTDILLTPGTSDCVSSHWMRRRTVAGSGNQGARLAFSASANDFFLQTDVTPNLMYCFTTFWQPVGHIGYTWATSNGGTVYWQVDELEPNARQLGATGSYNEDDTIPLKDLCYFFQQGKSVFLPIGYYTTTEALQIWTVNANTFRGEGAGLFNASIILPIGAIHGIEITTDVSQFSGRFRDFAVVGGSETLDGIHSPSTVLVDATSWDNVWCKTGRHGFYIGSQFSHTLNSCYGLSVTDGCGFAISGGTSVLLNQCNAGASGTFTAAFRIAGGAQLNSCNSIFLPIANIALWVGSTSSFSGTAQSGAAGSITLAAGTAGASDRWIGMQVVTTGGTGSGQTRTITVYNSATKVATVTPNWTVTPDNTTTYTVQEQVDFMRADNYPQISAHYCNFEDFSLYGVFAPTDISRITLDMCSFLGTGSYKSSVWLNAFIGYYHFVGVTYSGVGTYGYDIVTLNVPDFGPAGTVFYYLPSATAFTYGVNRSTTVAGLAAAGSVPVGARCFVTDANATTFNSTVAAGGANKVPVVSNGTNWLIG